MVGGRITCDHAPSPLYIADAGMRDEKGPVVGGAFSTLSKKRCVCDKFKSKYFLLHTSSKKKKKKKKKKLDCRLGAGELQKTGGVIHLHEV